MSYDCVVFRCNRTMWMKLEESWMSFGFSWKCGGCSFVLLGGFQSGAGLFMWIATM
jgi:hypothetical protein